MPQPPNQPLDEDAAAAALARIANTAAQALDDTTQPDVGYPGLAYPHDVAEVLEPWPAWPARPADRRAPSPTCTASSTSSSMPDG